VLSFVRSFENGPERVQTFDAGAEGRRGEAYDLRDDDGDGFVDNNLQPLGGMAEVIYYLDDRQLMRGISAPVRATGNNLFSGRAQPLIDNVLYLGFRFWGEFTRGWEDAPLPPSHSGQVHQIGTNPHVATRIWDSTRGFSIQGLERFPLHVNPKLTPDGKGSLADFSDDVFPEMVQITLVVEGDPRRAPRAHLSVPVTEAATRLVVDSTEGFPDVPAGTQGGVDCHILVGNEWMRYSQKGDDYFVIAERGARRTSRTVHEAGAEVRVGKTFVTRVYIPAWRENLEPEGRTRRGFLQ
jgi:hypothetical protein